jgi:hypothetical protein
MRRQTNYMALCQEKHRPAVGHCVASLLDIVKAAVDAGRVARSEAARLVVMVCDGVLAGHWPSVAMLLPACRRQRDCLRSRATR